MPPVSWCDNCNVPILDNDRCDLCHSSTRVINVGDGEVRPVFSLEKKWYEELLNENGFKIAQSIPDGLSFYHRAEIIIDGRKVFRVLFDNKHKSWKVSFFKNYIEDPVELEGSDPERTIKANEKTLSRREYECSSFLKETLEKYEKLPVAVSFSGGKDSTVVLALTRQIKRLGFDVIFLNTTLAFPETVEYVRRLTGLWNLRLLETKPHFNFFELCEQLGPPSRFMKWCCKTQKFAPLNELIEREYPEGVLVVSGLRKAESRLRMNLKRIQRNEKIPKQLLTFPIIDWSSLHVWLYLLWKRIPYCSVYEHGFSRIGCWTCPEKSLRKAKIIERSYPELMKKLYMFLERYAEENGYDRDWVYDGKWRLRATKYSRITACSSKLCSRSDEILYVLKETEIVDRAKEFLKIFGEAHETKSMTMIIGSDIEISIIGNNIRAVFLQPQMKKLFERQLEKAFNCVGCGACVGSCKQNALTIINGEIKIAGSCNHCLECIRPKGLRMGCVSLNYKPVILTIKKYEET